MAKASNQSGHMPLVRSSICTWTWMKWNSAGANLRWPIQLTYQKHSPRLLNHWKAQFSIETTQNRLMNNEIHHSSVMSRILAKHLTLTAMSKNSTPCRLTINYSLALHHRRRTSQGTDDRVHMWSQDSQHLEASSRSQVLLILRDLDQFLSLGWLISLTINSLSFNHTLSIRTLTKE